MERINPTSFYGPRAYFTDIDWKIAKFKHNREVYKREVERRLKVLLLTKNIVVCAGSHFANEFAYNLLKDNPILLKENMIIPTLRRDKQHITDYLEGKKIRKPLKESMKNFYEDHASKGVDWELMEETIPFKANLLRALKDEFSVIRRNLPNLSEGKLDSLLSEIERHEILTREIIIDGISNWSTNEQRILLNFVNLVYHMVGARNHNCESALLLIPPIFDGNIQ